MNKLDPVIYNKLMLQAEEAREQGMVKLAEAIVDAIGPEPAEEKSQYSYSEMKEDIHRDLWKVASKLMYYYDVDSADAVKLDNAIIHFAAKMIDEIEMTLGVNDMVKGPLEPKVPGETK